MKNSNFIADEVFKLNLNYTKLQNKTKELFFRCLDEERDIDYFKTKIRKIWGNIDYSYQDEKIDEYEAIIHKKNIEGKEIVEDIPKGEEGSLFPLVPIAVIMGIDKMFVKIKEREYKNSSKSYAYKKNKKEYLKSKVPRYNSDTIPYHSKTTGKIVRFVSPSTYNSMIYNTNLTYSGWNQTLNDADELDMKYFIIDYHPFSCEYCMQHQNKLMSKQQVIDLVGFAERASGDILHPNCKCELEIIDPLDMYNRKIPYSNLTDEEKTEISHIRQKVNSLTLKKERVLTDMKIQKSLGNEKEFDKLNQQRNKINKSIRELKEALPTTELQKQVVAINR